MELLYPPCGGLDVHQGMVMARVRWVSEPAVDETRCFATTTAALDRTSGVAELACRHTRGDEGDGGGVLEAGVTATCRAQCLRLRARRGAKRPFSRVAASMLNAAWHMLKDRVEYEDLGAGDLTRRDRSKAIRRLVRRLNHLSCNVELSAEAA